MKENTLHQDNNINKKKSEQEELAISSTGYGYESVSNQSVVNQDQTETNPSCGGL